MKCHDCKTFKKADNCQNCFIKLRNNYYDFITELWELSNITHISSLDKIIKKLKEKKEEIRNFAENV